MGVQETQNFQQSAFNSWPNILKVAKLPRTLRSMVSSCHTSTLSKENLKGFDSSLACILGEKHKISLIPVVVVVRYKNDIVTMVPRKWSLAKTPQK